MAEFVGHEVNTLLGALFGGGSLGAAVGRLIADRAQVTNPGVGAYVRDVCAVRAVEFSDREGIQNGTYVGAGRA
jgi:hypothetical protein